MAKIVAVMACPTGIAHTVMAAEALERTAKAMGHTLRAEMQSSAGAKNVLTEQEIREADVVIIATDIYINMDRFSGKPVYAVSTSDAIRKTRAVIEAALAEAEEARVEAAAPLEVPAVPAVPPPPDASRFLVAVTSCPTGIAHTFMAAEALRKAAESMGYQIKVETQGSVGAQNTLTFEEIARADAVIIAADAFVDKTRFAGKRLYETSTKEALHAGPEVITRALAQPEPTGADLADLAKEMKKARAAKVTGPYKHLMTGVSYMLPIVVAGGILIALAFAFGGITTEGYPQGSLAWALMLIGGGTAFALFVPVLAAFIAYSIADRPGIAPGIIGGMLATTVGSGFLGGIVAGFLAGYVTLALNKYIKLPKNLQGLMPVLILPVLSTLAVGLAMVYVIGPPMKVINDSMTAWLQGMQTGSALVLGVILGAMMAFDMGGPVNKAAYTFSVGLLGNQIFEPMAAVMAAGMTPPLGLALAAYLFKDRFTPEEHEAAGAAAVLGFSFITEGAIPFAARDPFRTIPSLMVGSAVAAALSMAFRCGLHVPHGGVFVLPIPNAVDKLGLYALAIIAGTLATAGMLFVLKKPLTKSVQAFAREAAAV
ncbi:MAG: PTS fructose-like transporter subunit IIB [Caldilineales bacterium]|nr:PTS fructose-like transporter subunit IIB [Caldilineales bacterium]MDW8318403.1 PTS fructose-like transporter subunit IIB [Anaerolineae bacterium]